MLNNPKRSRKTFRFTGSGIEGGEQKKESDHREYKGTRQESRYAEFHYDLAFLLLGIKVANEIGAEPSDRNANARACLQLSRMIAEAS